MTLKPFVTKALFMVLFIFVTLFKSIGQETSALNFLPGIPQTLSGNPAKHTREGKLIIGIPVLSGINLNANSNIEWDYLFDDEGEYDIRKLNQHLTDKGEVQAEVHVTTFMASLRHNNHTFSFSSSDKIFSNGSFDKQIFELLGEDITGLYGNDLDIGTSSMQLGYYKELAFGFASEVKQGFSIGIRPKILFGKFLFDSENINLISETNLGEKRLEVSTQGNFFLSGPFTYNDGFRSDITAGDYFLQLKNMGFAIDAGFDWHINESIEVSASIQDLGSVGFSHNSFDMMLPRPVYYHYDSLPQYAANPDKALEMLIDSVSYLLEVTDAKDKRVNKLPTKINVSGKYNINKNISLGIHNQYSYYRNSPANLLTLFATTNAGNRFSFAGKLTMYNTKRILTGIGAVYNGNRMQYYLASNNISGLIYPSSSKHLNLSFGINFLIDTQ